MNAPSFLTRAALVGPFMIVVPWDTIDRPGNYSDWVQSAIVRGWTHGDRVLATYGPLAFLGFRLGDATLYWPRIAISSLLLGFLVCRLTAHASRVMPPALVPIWLTAALYPLCIIGWLEFSPVLSLPYVACAALALDLATDEIAHRPGLAAGYGVLLAMFALVKISHAPLAMAAIAVVCAATAVGGRQRPALAIVAAAFGTFAFTWAVTGQRLDCIAAYLGFCSDIVRGYANAMSLWRPESTTAWRLFLTTAAMAILAGALAAPLRGWSRWTVAAALVLGLAISHLAMSGFTRADDEHFQYSLLGIVTLATLLAPFTLRQMDAAARPWVRACSMALAVAALACGWLGVAPIVRHNWPMPWDRIRAFATLILHPTADAHPVERASAGAVQTLIRGIPTDCPAEQDGLLAEWFGRPCPRPTLTSYAAYTPALAAANRLFLESPAGPEAIVLRDSDPKDWMYPTITDNRSYVTLLTHFFHRTSEHERHLFFRRSTPLAARFRPLSSTAISDAPIDVPDVPFLWCIVRLDRELPPQRLTLQPAVLMLDGRLATDEPVMHRLIPEMARDGFLLSPYVKPARSLPGLDATGGSAARLTSIRLRGFTSGINDPNGMQTGRPLQLAGTVAFSEIVLGAMAE